MKMEKQLWFHVYSDYRTGMNVCVYVYNRSAEDTEDEENEPDDALEILFKLPEQGHRMYLKNEYTCYNTEPIWSKDLSEDDDYEKIYKKIFSQIHGCLPFEVTGYNSSYKEEGKYPEISKDILNLETVEIPSLDEEGFYFLCVLDYKGNELFTDILTPCF